jgi:predicted TIM-barrel fold metal-dependent hydrolase
MLDDLLADIDSGHNIRSTVFVECASMYSEDNSKALAPVGETEFVQGLAAQCASGEYGEIRAAAGIISFADLLLGHKVEDILLAHQQTSPNRFRGIRHACSWDASEQVRNSHTKPPPHLYLDDKFREGFSCLGGLNLVFDAWLYHTQLKELLSLARAYPEQSIVLDHVGGPLGIGPYAGMRDEIFITWKKNIQKIASCENVVIKLGGIGMAINGFDWHKHPKPPTSKQLASANEPYFVTCIEAFGIDRCMFESNFPVDKVSASYGVLWNSFKRITAGCSSPEKAKLYHDNAARVYSLPGS